MATGISMPWHIFPYSYQALWNLLECLMSATHKQLPRWALFHFECFEKENNSEKATPRHKLHYGIHILFYFTICQTNGRPLSIFSLPCQPSLVYFEVLLAFTHKIVFSGIHYVGKIQSTSFSRTILDQISDGQIRWQPLDKNYDTVSWVVAKFCHCQRSYVLCCFYLVEEGIMIHRMVKTPPCKDKTIIYRAVMKCWNSL